jgi:hypothetical protein
VTQEPAENDLVFVLRVVDLFAAHGLRGWLFGGWAEELRGVEPPRRHDRVELLYPAPSFRLVDELILAGELEQLSDGRPHVRTILVEGVPVELVLVRRAGDGWLTDFPGGPHHWPADVFERAAHPPVASSEAVESFRARVALLHSRAA